MPTPHRHPPTHPSVTVKQVARGAIFIYIHTFLVTVLVLDRYLPCSVLVLYTFPLAWPWPGINQNRLLFSPISLLCVCPCFTSSSCLLQTHNHAVGAMWAQHRLHHYTSPHILSLSLTHTHTLSLPLSLSLCGSGITTMHTALLRSTPYIFFFLLTAPPPSLTSPLLPHPLAYYLLLTSPFPIYKPRTVVLGSLGSVY